MDAQVEFIALYHEIPLKSLDTPQLISKMDKKVFTCKYVEEGIKSYSLCPETIKTRIEAYKTGDLLYNQDDMDSNVSQIVLKERNEKWFTQFKSVHSDYKRVFVAAGVAHFMDSFNFIDMLESEGFSVERVSC